MPLAPRHSPPERIERDLLAGRCAGVLLAAIVTSLFSPQQRSNLLLTAGLAVDALVVWAMLRGQPGDDRVRRVGALAMFLDTAIVLGYLEISGFAAAAPVWIIGGLLVVEASVRWQLIGGLVAGSLTAAVAAVGTWAHVANPATSALGFPAGTLLVLGVGSGALIRRIRTLEESDDAGRRGLTRLQERLRLALDVSGTLTWDYDISQSRLVVSENFEDLVGLPASDFSLFYDALMEMVDPEDRGNVELDVARGEFDSDYRLTLPHSEVRWMHAKGLILSDAAGVAVRSIGVATDVTARKSAEAARREAEDVLGTTIQLASDAFVGIDDSGRIIDWNPAAEETFGWARDEILGSDADEKIIPSRYRDSHRRWLRRSLLATHRSRLLEPRQEMAMLHRSGVEFPVELTIIAIRRAAGITFKAFIRDISRRVALQAQLTRMALHDPLTGLANRNLLTDRLNTAVARLTRRPALLAVISLDLDHFKVINDGLGHSGGDDVLRAVGERLMSSMRPADTVARFGGDEFVVITEDVASEASALSLASRLGAAVAQPIDVGGTDIVVTASFGVATTSTSDRDADRLLRDADAAMYLAKDRGRATCELFDETIRGNVLARMELEQDLRRALDRSEFEVHFQPLQTIFNSRPIGAEALVRWRHPTRGLVNPGEFIPIAEETGLITRIGGWVLGAACAEAATWESPEGGTPLGLSVNLSARELADPQLLTRVRTTLDDTGLDPGRLTLEITETAVMANPAFTAGILEQLHDLRLRIAVDDFGTGYSSLPYLRQFPVDTLKIDRVFIAGLIDDADDATIVRAVIRLAHELGLSALAEGVETDEQREQLEWLGCDLGQGFLWSRPLPAAEFRDWLAVTRVAGNRGAGSETNSSS